MNSSVFLHPSVILFQRQPSPFPSRDHYVSIVAVCRLLQVASASLIYLYAPTTSISRRVTAAAPQSNTKNHSPANIYHCVSTEITKFCCNQSIPQQLKPHYTQTCVHLSILIPSHLPTAQTTQNRHRELSITGGATLRTPCCAKRPPQYPWQQEQSKQDDCRRIKLRILPKGHS